MFIDQIKPKKIIALSKKDTINLTYRDFTTNRVIISINDMDSNIPHFNKHNPTIKDIMYVFFDDVLENEKNAMTKEDAEKIVNFAKKYIDKDTQIIVHCTAGISRSAGVAMGLCDIFGINKNHITRNPDCVPNMHCYNQIANILSKKIFQI